MPLIPPEDTSRWHALEVSASIDALQTDSTRGLSPGEARARCDQHGPNRLVEQPGPGPLRRFFAQFADVTVGALLVAAVIAVLLAFGESGSFLERFGDAIAISAIVLLNAIIGFVQEQRAESALRGLMDMTAPEATVIRGGVHEQRPAVELVPGDVVVLEEGDRVPADLRLIDATKLTITEASLTGESVGVEKHTSPLEEETPLAERKNLAFMGTHVSSGHGVGVVIATGMRTELGQIAGMLSRVTVADTPLQQDLQRFGTRVVIGCGVIALVVFAVGYLRLDEPLRVLFLTAVSLAVAAIPEGLPAITTIVLAMGVQRMAKRRALVRRLASVETLGSARVICTDKTGTLTQNKMMVRRLLVGSARRFSVGGHVGATTPAQLEAEAEAEGDTTAAAPDIEADDALRAFWTASRFATAAHLEPDPERPEGPPVVMGDATDGALLLFHHAMREVLPEGKILGEAPFDASRKRATVLVEMTDGVRVAFTHGAPEAVLDCCACAHDGPLDEAAHSRIDKTLEAWADQGFRVIALARREVDASGDDLDALALGAEDQMTLLGLVGISDPPRPEVRDAIAKARRAGVRTVMITGDHPRTGRAIARELGLLSEGGEVVAGRELDALEDEALSARAPTIEVVARATAAHKLRFVEALQRRGEIVAMTGDGVNDAPALKASNIGVAMGRGGTDVAREASDIVLADDNYATIIAAIEEGRIIFSNIKKFIIFLISINIGLVLAVFVGALAGWPSLMTPTQILWINLVTNGLPALALGMEPIHLDPMSDSPRDPKAPLITRDELIWMSGYGLLMAIVGLGLFRIYADDPALAQTMAFTFMAVSPLMHAFNCRSRTDNAWQLGVFSNGKLWGAVGVGLILQAMTLYIGGLTGVFSTTPLSASQVLLALGLAVGVWIAGEAQKLVTRALRARGVRD